MANYSARICAAKKSASKTQRERATTNKKMRTPLREKESKRMKIIIFRSTTLGIDGRHVRWRQEISCAVLAHSECRFSQVTSWFSTCATKREYNKHKHKCHMPSQSHYLANTLLATSSLRMRCVLTTACLLRHGGLLFCCFRVDRRDTH